jgi:hypothetical protein
MFTVKMVSPYLTAFKIAQELTKTKLASSQEPANMITGQNAGEFFEEIYNKVLDVAKKAEQQT